MRIWPWEKQVIKPPSFPLSRYQQYHDDVFDLWQQGLPALQDFTNYVNSWYPAIKFELVFSESELHVLDLTLHFFNGFIRTDVYPKPTDSRLYLPPSSAHLKHKFIALPHGVATRLQRNCSDKTFLAKRITKYKGYFTNQGYTPLPQTSSLSIFRGFHNFKFIILYHKRHQWKGHD